MDVTTKTSKWFEAYLSFYVIDNGNPALYGGSCLFCQTGKENKMFKYICPLESSDEDLECFRKIRLTAGKFMSLLAYKMPDEVSTKTRIEFEDMILVLNNLNIGYGGSGPACLAQILVELGMGRELARKKVSAYKRRMEVRCIEVSWFTHDDNDIIVKHKEEELAFMGGEDGDRESN